jgi:O-antigen/teichoic acid export membrane protein
MKARDVLDFIIRFKAFSLFGTLQELISVSAFYSPMILFVRHFDKDIGGQYAMANRLVWAPVILLSGSLTQVLYHRYANELPSKETKLFKLLPNWKLVSFSLLVCGVSFYLKPIFLFILGKQWGLASNMLPLILLWGVVFFLSTPFRVLCRVMQLQKYQLSIDLGMLIAILALFELTSFSPISLMIGLVTIAATQNFLLIFFLYRALLQSNGPVMA